MNTQKQTVNQLLEIINSLPSEIINNQEISNIRKKLLDIKSDTQYDGFGGNIVLENYQEINNILKKYIN